MASRMDRLESAMRRGYVAFITEYTHLKLSGSEGCCDDVKDNKDDTVKVIDWFDLLCTAYRTEHNDIVRYIHARDKLTYDEHLQAACEFGDIDFLQNAIDNDKDPIVDWNNLLVIAYTYDHLDIIRYIQDSGTVDIFEQLEAACMFGDCEFVRRCIADNRDEGEEVDWEWLIRATCLFGNTDITQCITAANKNLTLYDNIMLLACVYGKSDGVAKLLCHIHDEENKYDSDSDDIGFYDILYCYYVTSYNCSHTTVADLIIDKHRSALHTAVQRFGYDMNRDAVEYLMSHSEDFPPQPVVTLLHASCNAAIKKQWVVLAIKFGADVNADCYMRQTPLHLLCQGHNQKIKYGWTMPVTRQRQQHRDKLIKQCNTKHDDMMRKARCVPILIQHGAIVNATDVNGQSPLHLACTSGAFRIVRRLLDNKADVNMIDGIGMSPIAIASIHGHAHIIEILLNGNCNPHILNQYDQSSFYLACMQNHLKCAKVLLPHSNINQPDSDDVTPVSISAWNGHTDVVTFLLDNDCDANQPDTEGQSPLHKVCKSGFTDTAKILLQYRVNIDVQDITRCTPLHLASKQHVTIVQMLIDAKCSIDVIDNIGNSAFHTAIISKQKDIAQLLLSHKVDIDQKNHSGESPLMSATTRLDIDLVTFLVENNADVNTTDNMGRGLLHAVVTSNYHSTILQNLMITTTKIEVEEFGEHTLIMLFNNEKSPCQKILVEPNTESVNQMGRNLTQATIATAFDITIIEYLLAKKMDINAIDYNQQTILHLATASGYIGAVKYLIGKGANVFAKDKFGQDTLMTSVHEPRLLGMIWTKFLEIGNQLSQDEVLQVVHIGHWNNCIENLDICQLQKCSFQQNDWPQNVKLLGWEGSPDSISTWLRSDSDNLPQFMTGWLENLQPLTYIYNPTISEVMEQFIIDIAAGVEKIDTLFAFDFLTCGSENEKTKVMAMDELDIQCLQKNIRFDMFEKPTIPAHPALKSFVELKCKAEFVGQLQNIIDSENKLSPKKFFKGFSQVVAKVLSNPELWSKFSNLQRMTVKDITAGNATIAALNVRWHDEVYPLLDISIDLMPTIAMPDGWPSWSTDHPLIDKLECIAVPKWKSLAPLQMPLMEVGVCRFDALFDEMPEEMRQGYRLAKVVKDKAVCPQMEEWVGVDAGDFISSYMLKQCIIKQYADFYDEGQDSFSAKSAAEYENDATSESGKTDLYYARRIYEMMEEALQIPRLESFVFPGYNLLNDSKYVEYMETSVGYARLCRRLLIPEAARHFRKAYMSRGDE